jgi:MFS family permease
MTTPIKDVTAPTAGDSGAIAAIRARMGERGAAWLVLILALSGPPLSSFQTTIVAPLGSSIAHHFGGGNHGAMVAQLNLTLSAVGVIVGGPFAAWLIGRLGYRPVIVASALLLTLSGSLCAILDNIYLFLTARFVVGMSAVAVYSALVGLSGALFSGVTLGRMISYQNGVSAIMGMGLVLLSGWVASHFGWRVSFLIYLSAGVFAVLGMVAWLPAKAVRKSSSERRVSLRPLVPVYLITIGVFVVVFMVMVQGSLLMSANGIEDPSIQSIVIAASTVAYAATAMACSWIETHVTRKWTFTAALCLLAAGALTMGAIPAVWGATLGSLLLGAGSGLTTTYLVKVVIERAPAGARDRAVGLIAPAHYLGQFSNPLVMQPLRVTLGIETAFVLIGLVLLAAAAATATTVVRRNRAAAQAL